MSVPVVTFTADQLGVARHRGADVEFSIRMEGEDPLSLRAENAHLRDRVSRLEKRVRLLRRQITARKGK